MHDIVIRGGTIVDGTGAPAFQGDVAIDGDRIAAVGPVGKIDGAKEIDGKGLVVCPGFIDLHTHCDSGVQDDKTKANKNYITQGCTTVVTASITCCPAT